MKWSDKAIVLSTRHLGENAAIITLLTAEHGIYAGVDRGARGKAKRGIYQIGNKVLAHWQARLAEQLGMLNCELAEPVAARILDSAEKLAVMNAAAGMVEKTLPEREKQAVIFQKMESLIHSLCHDKDYLADYVRLEFSLLAASGFGLDLERCAATGQAHDLLYVSPKSGRAVSREAGRPYQNRLLALPVFLSAEQTPPEKVAMREIMEGIKICSHFFHERIFNHRNLPLPAARTRLTHMLGGS